MSPFHSFFCFATLFFLPFTSAYIVTTEKWEPDVPLIPGKTLFYNVVVEAKDTVVLVDIILANGILGNTSDIFADSDLRKQDDRNAGFTVPFVPPGKQYTVRVVETATKRFLADSPQFEIFAANGGTTSSAQSLPATTLPPISRTTTGAPPSSSPSSRTTTNAAPSGSSAVNTASSQPVTASSTTANASSSSASGSTVSTSTAPNASDAAGSTIVSEKSKTPVGAIAGGVVGGLAVIGLGIFFLLWRRRRGAPATINPDDEKTYGLASPGPHAVEPYTLPPTSVRPGAGYESTASLTDARSTSAGPLPSKLAMGYGFAGTASSFNAGSSSHGDSVLSPGTMPVTSSLAAGSSRDASRVEQLRLERERINRELAALEQRPGPGSNTTGNSSYGASSFMPPSSAGSQSNQESLAEQLAILQTQIRQLEERQQYRDSDLPPMYDGSPAPSAGTTGAVSDSTSRYPADSKR